MERAGRRAGLAARALVMVWDGMRPDLVHPARTPNLAALAGRGVWFEASHAVFPTVTRINAATLATGAEPAAHGLPGNMLYAPLVDPARLISLGEGESVPALAHRYGVFRPPTVADVVAEHGGRTAVVSNGTRGSALMCHPRVREKGDVLLHPTLSGPADLAPVVARLGPLPAAAIPDSARNRWFARAAAEYVLPELGPKLLVLWHNDPDKSQHRHGFGHPLSLRAIRDADENLGLVLGALEQLGLRRDTAIVVASDHGYVSVGRRVDLATELVAAGLKAAPDSTDVIVAPNGGAVLVYVPDGGHERTGRLARFLLAWHGTEVVFSGARGMPVLDGTAPLATIGVDGPLAPELLVGLRWDDGINEHGHAGRSAENGATNLAGHGGLSAWELRNTLLLAGPGIRAGHRSAVPAGSIDVAPTLLHLLGLPMPPTVTGRLLTEALALEGNPAPAVSRSVIAVEGDVTRAELHWSVVDGHRYLDSGRSVSAT